MLPRLTHGHLFHDRGVERRAVPVVVVDDLAAFRRAAACVIDAVEGFVLAGEATTGEQAMMLVEQHSAGLVVMDVNLPGMGGIEAAEEIGRRFPDVVVFLLSVYEAADLREKMPPDVQFCHKGVFGPDELEAMWKRRPLGPP